MVLDLSNVDVFGAEFEVEQLAASGPRDDLSAASCSGCRGCSNTD
jgi:hypothetical protein